MEKKKFTFAAMRHGHKLAINEKLGPLEQSGLTFSQQQKWKLAVERLKGDEPEIRYDTIPLIEEKARELFAELPENSLVLFTSSQYPRARILADLMSTTLIELNEARPEKDLSIAFLWEPKEMASKDESIYNIARIDEVASSITSRMKKIQERDYSKDSSLLEYFSESCNRAHPFENQIVFTAVNEDLSQPDSVLRAQGKLLKKQIQHVQTMYADFERPIFLLVAGHHSNLIALDTAYNNRTAYASVEQIPAPLALWCVPSDKLSNQ